MTNPIPSDDEFPFAESIMSAWAEQPTHGVPDLASDSAPFIEGLQVAHRKDQRRLFWLNAREVLPCFVAAGFFVSQMFDAEHPAAVLAGALLTVAVGCFLLITSIRQYKADRGWGASVRDQLARRLAQLHHGAWLLRHVGWWYFLPFSLAILLFAYGFGQDFGSADGVIFVGVMLAVGSVAYVLNRRNGRLRYESEIKRLEPLLADFDSD